MTLPSSTAAGRCGVVGRGPGGSSVAPLLRPVPPPVPVKRGDIRGLSRQAAARHVAFLQSVDEDKLTGFGYSPTFTMRNVPESLKRWTYLRGRLWRYFRDRGDVLRLTWTVEDAQVDRGGVPHMHLAVYFDHQLSALELWQIKEAWCRIAKTEGALHAGQHIGRIRPGHGWSKYCAKHSARTQRHYQRVGARAEWGGKSGRVWGRSGDWPTRIDRFLLNPAALVELRRVVRSFLVADAKTSACRLAAARGAASPAGAPACSWCGRRLVHRCGGVVAARGLLRAGVDAPVLRGMRAWIGGPSMDRLMLWVADRPGCVVAEIIGEGGGPWGQRIDSGRQAARSRLGVDPPERPPRRGFVVRPLGRSDSAPSSWSAAASLLPDELVDALTGHA